jgi:hypothetical protein
VILVLAALVFALRASVAVNDPVFSGDSAFRLTHARELAVRLDHRVWLPLLQTNIRILYESGAPAWAFKLIPPFHLSLAVFLLGLLVGRLTGRSREGAIFAVALSLCFLNQHPVFDQGGQLMQEGLGMALFFLLLLGGALELRKSKWLLVAGCAALLARDAFWIYLFALTLLNAPRIWKDRDYRRAFLLLWSIPLLWYGFVCVRFLVESGQLPMLMNKQGGQALADLPQAWKSLADGIIRSRVFILYFALLLIWAVSRFWRGFNASNPGPAGNFSRGLWPFSIVSLAIVYSLILLLDPWQATPGNSRMAIPAIEHAYVWAAVFFAISAHAGTFEKIFTRAILVVALVASAYPRPGMWSWPDYSATKDAYARIERHLEREATQEEVLICVAAGGYWDMLRDFSAPAIYHRLLHHTDTAALGDYDCGMVITATESPIAPDASWRHLDEVTIGSNSYSVYWVDR